METELNIHHLVEMSGCWRWEWRHRSRFVGASALFTVRVPFNPSIALKDSFGNPIHVEFYHAREEVGRFVGSLESVRHVFGKDKEFYTELGGVVVE